jgi:transposase
MSRRIDYQLSNEQLGELEEAINTSPSPEVRQRAIAIRLLHLGQSPAQVAQAVMVTSNTIYAWHKRWREHGIDGLRDGQRTGRPRKRIRLI